MANNKIVKKSVDLVVVKSNLYTPGVARVHKNIPRKIEVINGSFVEVDSKDEKVITKLQTDRLIDEHEIALSSKELKRLNVNEGDFVSIHSRRRLRWFEYLKR